MGALDFVVIKSTGQTLADLEGLAALEALSSSASSSTFVSPSFTNPNYVPPHRDTRSILIGSCVGLFVTAVFVIVRIVSAQRCRASKNKTLFLEDWLLLMAVALGFVVITATWVAIIRFQLGMHVYDIHIASIVMIYKGAAVAEVCSIWYYVAVRLSLLVSIRRLYSPFQTRMRRVIDALIFLKLVCGIVMTVAIMVPSIHHPNASWDIYEALKYNVDDTAATISTCAIGIGMDVFVIATPIPLFFKLKRVSLRRKIITVVIYSFGLCSLMMSSLRMYEVIKLNDSETKDVTWNLPVIFVFAQAEVIVSICTTCLPTAAIFFRWAYPKSRRQLSRLSPRHNVIPFRSTSKRDRGLQTLSSTISETNDDMEMKQSPRLMMGSITTTTAQSLASSLNLPMHVQSQASLHLPIQNPPASASATRPGVKFSRPVIAYPSIPPEIKINRSSISKSRADVSVATSMHVRDDRESALEDGHNDDDDDDNFFVDVDEVVPSDSFFPYATGLQPRPSARGCTA